MLSGLYVASVLRSVTEHHDLAAGDKWTNARSIVTHPVLEFLWSNVNYHLEHHLYSSVLTTRCPNCGELLLRNI